MSSITNNEIILTEIIYNGKIYLKENSNINRNNIWNEKCEIIGQIVVDNDNNYKLYLYDEPYIWDKNLMVKKLN